MATADKDHAGHKHAGGCGAVDHGGGFCCSYAAAAALAAEDTPLRQFQVYPELDSFGDLAAETATARRGGSFSGEKEELRQQQQQQQQQHRRER